MQVDEDILSDGATVKMAPFNSVPSHTPRNNGVSQTTEIEMNTHTVTPDSVPLPVRVLDMPTLLKRAQADHKHRVAGGPETKLTAAVVVNYIRHKLTPYDDARANFRRDDEAHRRIGVRVLNAIADRYAHVPWLVAEVKRQIGQRDERFAASDPAKTIRSWRAA